MRWQTGLQGSLRKLRALGPLVANGNEQHKNSVCDDGKIMWRNGT